MLKIFFKFLKLLIIGTLWTAVFAYIADITMILIWNFDILDMRHWQVINTFWEGGGKIKTGKDYVFVSMLLALIPLWLLGWYYFYKVRFLQLLLFPAIWYNNRMIKKYGEDSPRIVLKNLGASKSKPKIEDIIEQRLKQSIKPAEKASGKIRNNVKDKMSSAGKK